MTVLWPGVMLEQPSTANLNLSLCQKKKRFLCLGTLGHIHPRIIPQSPKSKRGMNCVIVSVEKIQYSWGVQGWHMMKACRGVQRFGKWSASDATVMLGKFLSYQLLFETGRIKICSGTERTILLAARNRYHHQDTQMLFTANTCYRTQLQILVLT